MVTTDSGPNEASARRIIGAEIADLPHVYFWEQTCLEHSPHLVVMGSLSIADELLDANHIGWKYWSSLAMFAHTARDCGKALYQSYSKRWGVLNAKHAVKCIFPRPIAQRWGRIHELEQRIQKAGFLKLAISVFEVLTSKWVDADELPASLHKTFKDLGGADDCATASHVWNAFMSIKQVIINSRQQKADKADSSEAASDVKRPNVSGPGSELRADQTKEHSVKMGKWRAKTLLAVSDCLWGLCIDVMNRTRLPLIHISNFLKKPVVSKELIHAGGPLAQLVFGRGAEIHQEFTTIMRIMANVALFFLSYSCRLLDVRVTSC